MKQLRDKLNSSFTAKILTPVIAVMVLILTVTVWLVDQHLRQQFQSDAARSLATADTEFRNAQQARTRNLNQRFRNLRNEPRYRAVFQSGHGPTIADAVKDLPGDQGVDIAIFSAADGKNLMQVTRNPMFQVAEFETKSTVAISRALHGETAVDTVRVGDHLFDVVAIPITGGSGSLIGVLTFGSEISSSDVSEFSLLTRSQVALLAGGRVITSSLANSDSSDELAQIYAQSQNPLHPPKPRASLQRVEVGGEHYYAASGRFASLSDSGRLGYLLLVSYEQPFRALQATQRQLLLVCCLAILAGTAIVWLLVRRATAPLRILSDSAEAVGKGDFSRRVPVTSTDECGELALVFNQMTENLQRSRKELESTVETLRTTQTQLVQSEKLSGIGEFVAGVAHELNNPLTSVMGFSELLERGNIDARHKRHLELIRKSAQRCQKIVQSLLSFARRHQPERKLTDLNELIACAVDFLQYQLRTSNIEVQTQLDPAIPKAMVDPHQIQQVCFNIINNARQAIENHKASGSIRIRSEARGDSARIVIQDDGPGITEKNLNKVFDPFFTTKDVGKGTGLGLSLCYGIIQEHGGTISVLSRPGEGACFTIDLPLLQQGAEIAEPAPDQAGQSDEMSATAQLRIGSGKRVLVIDDEDSILQMIRETLTDQGYQVDVARDGEAALARLSQSPYDLALCDWKMPGLNGQQVFERLQVSNPALSERMIFLTGDVINEKAQRFLQERNKLCLSKPFSLAEFSAAVSKALATS